MKYLSAKTVCFAALLTLLFLVSARASHAGDPAVLQGVKVLALDLSRDGKLLGVAGVVPASKQRLGIIKLWQLPEKKELHSATFPHADVLACSFSPKNDLFAYGGYDKNVAILDPRTKKIIFHEKLTGSVDRCAFSPDGSLLAVSTWDGPDNKEGGHFVALWQTDPWKKVWESERLINVYLAVRFSPDGKRLAGAGDKTIKVWTVDDRKQLYHFLGHTDLVNALVFSPDGKFLVSSSGERDKTVRIWDMDNGRIHLSLPVDGTRVLSLAFAAKANLLFAGGSTPLQNGIPAHSWVDVWDFAKKQKVTRFKTDGFPPTGLAVTPDEASVISGSYDGTVKIWDLRKILEKAKTP